MVVGMHVGAYRLLQQIGEGGMGTVWLAEHTMLGRRAAIKLLHPSFTARPDIVTRFFNEARAATAISDPGIVQIFDFGHHADGTAYIAMEMLDGEPLDRRLRRLGRLPVADALRIMRQAASTLGVAHARGIVHRDLKPENVFLVRDPEVVGGERAKILDFGIAKLTGDSNVKTHTSAVMGTPAYMSPEQCRGAGQVDQRSDIYSLGCMLFTLVAGAPPFDAEGAGEIIAMHLREPPPLLSSRAPGIPAELDALVQHCLAKDPAYRYTSGTDLAAALGALLGATSNASLPQAGASAPLPRAGSAAVTTLSAATGVAAPARGRRSRGLWIAATAIAVAAAAIAIVVTRGAPSSATSATSEPAAPPTATPPATPPPGVVTEPPPATAPAPDPAASAPAPTAPDPGAALAVQMKALFASFLAWSRDNAGAPCPTPHALGSTATDPWGNDLRITCSDQPSNQIIGAISAGPDGRFATKDDIGSWQLGSDITDVVHGPRWVGRLPSTRRPGARPQKPAKPEPNSEEDDDIPRER
jgi:tRNA A-37 threonylcarbamoyl transferase component Bud32